MNERMFDVALEIVVGRPGDLAARIAAEARRRGHFRRCVRLPFGVALAAATLMAILVRPVGDVPSARQDAPLREIVLEDPDDDAVAALKRHAQLKSVVILGVSDHCIRGAAAHITDKGVASLRELKRLKSVRLDPCPQVTDEGMKALAGIATLETLRIAFKSGENRGMGGITDAGIEAIATLKLRELHLVKAHDRLTVRSARAIGAMKSLVRLDLDQVWIGDEGTEALAALPALEHLGLRLTRATDASLASVAALKTLKSLALDGEFGDAGVAHIVTLPALESLEIDGTQKLTDAGLEKLAGLRELKLPSCYTISDAGAAVLAKAGRIRSLDLSARAYHQGNPDINYERITDASLRALASCASLERLAVAGRDSIGDDGLRELAKSTSLRALDLTHCEKVTDAGIVALAVVTTLEELDLESCYAASDRAMEALSKLPRLVRLDLGATTDADNRKHKDELTDTGLKHVAAMPSLEVLSLKWRWNLGDRAMENLAAAPKLRDLNLDELKITPAGLAHLAKIGTLKKVRFYDMGTPGRLSDEDFTALAKALPACEIIMTSGAKYSASAARPVRIGDVPPEIESAKEDWINASEPLTLAALKGKPVLLAFQYET